MWSFRSKLKLGPLKGTVSRNVTGSGGKVTWYAMDSSNWVTIHRVEFKLNWEGSASYNLINIVGLVGSWLSNWMLLAITNWF